MGLYYSCFTCFILWAAVLFAEGHIHSNTTDDAVLASENLSGLLFTPIIVFSLLFSLLLNFPNILTFSSRFFNLIIFSFVLLPSII